MPPVDITVDLTAELLNQVKKAASALGHTVVSIQGEAGKISLVVKDPKNPSANQFSVVLDNDNKNKDSFDLQFLINNIKVINEDYKVEISQKLISKWSTPNIDIEYYIALEKTSTYGG